MDNKLPVEEFVTEAELEQQLAHLIGTTPQGEDKQTVHKFLHNVATAKDTTKVGFLNEEELGKPELTERACKELALISKKIMGNDFFKEYFEEEAEILTSTSLSKEAKLLELAVVQRREVADITKKEKPKENKGWFKKKNVSEE